MALSFIDIERPYSPSLNYPEAAIEPLSFAGEASEIPSSTCSIDNPPDSESKILTGQRLVKKIARFVSTIIKTLVATQKQPKKLKAVQHILILAKQGIIASKIVKTVFTISHESQDASWSAKVYNWTNMMKSLIVGAISAAPLFNPNFTGGKEIVSLCHIIRSGAKLVNHSETQGPSSLTEQEQKNITLLKICKTILSLIGEVFVVIGLVFGAALLPKPIFLILGLSALILGVVKSFYKQTRAPVDEFLTFP